MTGNEYSVTTLRDNPGIFYEAIGDMRTTEISWKMIIYVDIGDILRASKEIQRELDTVINQCNSMSNICGSQALLISLRTKLNKITYYQDHIRQIIGGSRTKRAPLDFIGQISKVLFGTLTTEDAFNINAAIMHVENKTDDLAALLINQTMVTRVSFGELYNTTLEMKQQMADLMHNINNRINNFTNFFVQQELYEQFEIVITKAILEHEIDLNILIDGILFGKQGLIHPRIITPQYLIENSKTIKEQIPYAEFPVAINEEGMDQLIKMSNLHIAYINNRLAYVLYVPILTPGKYKLYKSLPLPVKQTFDETKYATVKTDVRYIGLNEDADSFYEFQEDELKGCITSSNTFICPAIFPLKKIRQTVSCDIELLLNKNINLNHCKIILKELRDTYWKILTTPGSWIYSTVGKESIKIECPNSVKQLEIENAGIITIQRGCKIRAKSVTMSYPSIRTTKFLQHYMPTSNLSISQLYKPIREKYEINLTEATREIWSSNRSDIEATFDDIIEKARQIKERKIQNFKFITYSATTFFVSVLGTLSLIVFALYRSSWIRNTTNRLYKGCCIKGSKTKESTPHSSAHYINDGNQSPTEQSSLPDRTSNRGIHPEETQPNEVPE